MTSLATLRKSLNLSQAELASRLGISRPTLIKVEKGLRPLKAAEQQSLDQLKQSLAIDNQQMRISIPQKNIDKFQQTLLYILEQVGAKPNVGLTVLYKLLYFIDFDYYEKYHEQLMGLTYIKNTHGPTPREFKRVVDSLVADSRLVEVKSQYFKYEQKKYLPRVEADLSLLTGRELEMIDSALDRYGDKTATELSDMSHRDTPWKAAKDGQNIDYELAFYRPDEFSVGQYEAL